jgi:phage terminase large subunit-like protein
VSVLDPLDLMSGMVLESGDLWGSVAADFQVADARAIFDTNGPRWHFQTRPRGGSKSTDAAGDGLVWLATEAPAGARGYVVATDSDQAALLVDAAAGLVDRTPAMRSVVDVGALKMVARSGASVEVLSADGASAFGLRPHLLVVEEFAQWPQTRNARRLWTALLSALGKIPGSRLVILTSAGEPGHFSHKVLEEARRSDRWRVSEVPGPLPWVDPAELEAQRPLLRDSEFARLHLNVWTQSEDRLVSAEDLAAACVLDGSQAPRSGVKYVATLDVGVTDDACVAVVAHAERVSEEPGSSARVVVDRIARWRGSRRRPVDLTEVENWVQTASAEYHGAPLHADPYQAVGLLQRLKARGVRAEQFTFSAQSVGRVANALHLALRNRTILLPDDEDLRAELGRVRLRETSPGAVRLDHDSGEHDDQAVAIAIACAVLQGKVPSEGRLLLPQGRVDIRSVARTAPGSSAPPEVTPGGSPMPQRPMPRPTGIPEWQWRITRKVRGR